MFDEFQIKILRSIEYYAIKKGITEKQYDTFVGFCLYMKKKIPDKIL
jgi:hypothetical protein